MIRIAPGMFRVQNRVFRARFSTLPAAVVPGPGKVFHIRPKHFSTVLTENVVNITTNYVGMFRVQTESSGTGFQLYLFQWGLGSKKWSKLD